MERQPPSDLISSLSVSVDCWSPKCRHSMHLTRALGCVSGQLSQEKPAGQGKGAGVRPPPWSGRTDWEPGGAGPLPGKTGISAPWAGPHPEHPCQCWPPSPPEEWEWRPCRTSARRKRFPRSGVWEPAEAFPIPGTHTGSWSHLGGYARKGSAGGLVPGGRAGVVQRQRKHLEVLEDPYFAGKEVPTISP